MTGTPVVAVPVRAPIVAPNRSDYERLIGNGFKIVCPDVPNDREIQCVLLREPQPQARDPRSDAIGVAMIVALAVAAFVLFIHWGTRS